MSSLMCVLPIGLFWLWIEHNPILACCCSPYIIIMIVS